MAGRRARVLLRRRIAGEVMRVPVSSGCAVTATLRTPPPIILTHPTHFPPLDQPSPPSSLFCADRVGVGPVRPQPAGPHGVQAAADRVLRPLQPHPRPRCVMARVRASAAAKPWSGRVTGCTWCARGAFARIVGCAELLSFIHPTPLPATIPPPTRMRTRRLRDGDLHPAVVRAVPAHQQGKAPRHPHER